MLLRETDQRGSNVISQFSDDTKKYERTIAKKGLRELLEEEQMLQDALDAEARLCTRLDNEIVDMNTKVEAVFKEPIPQSDLNAFQNAMLKYEKETSNTLKANEKVKTNLFEEFQQINAIAPVKDIYTSLAGCVRLYKQLDAAKRQIVADFVAETMESNSNPNMEKIFARNLNKLLELSVRLKKYADIEQAISERWETLIQKHGELEKSIAAKLEVIQWKSNTIHNVLKNHLNQNLEQFEQFKHYIEELGALDQKESCRNLYHILETDIGAVVDDVIKNERLHIENSCIAEELKKEALTVEEYLEKLNQADPQLTIKGNLIRQLKDQSQPYTERNRRVKREAHSQL